MMRKLLWLPLFTAILLLVLGGCNLGDSPDDDDDDGNGGKKNVYTISGKVMDEVTGAGISGVKVRFANYSAASDSNGNYMIAIQSDTTTMKGTLAAFKDQDYSFKLVDEVSVDLSTNPSVEIYLAPATPSTITLAGDIYDNSTPTPAEISTGSQVTLVIINSQGGYSAISTTYDADHTPGYSIYTPTFGADCFVAVMVITMAGPMVGLQYSYYLTNQDLSSSKSNYDLTQPSAGYSTVTLNGTVDNGFVADLVVTNYGLLKNSSGYIAGILSIPAQDLQVYNPNNYQAIWATGVTDVNVPDPGDETYNMHYGAQGAFSTSVTLPAPVSGSGPADGVDGSSINYSPITRTLSFDTVSGATHYLLEFDADGGATLDGIAVLTPGSVTLPADLVAAVINPGSGWDINVKAIWSDPCMDLLKVLKYIQHSGSAGFTNLESIMVDGTASTPSSKKVDAIP